MLPNHCVCEGNFKRQWSRQTVTLVTFYVTDQPTGSLFSYETSIERGILQLQLNSISENANNPPPQAAMTATGDHFDQSPQPDSDLDMQRQIQSHAIETTLRAQYPQVFEGIGQPRDHKQKLHSLSDMQENTFSFTQTIRRHSSLIVVCFSTNDFHSELPPQVFQNAIQNALQGLEGTRNIADDIIVCGSTHKEHDDHLNALFARLSSKGQTVNPAKCLYKQESLWFYGYTLTNQGLQADRKKIAATQNTTVPQDVTQLRSLLCSFYSEFRYYHSTVT